MHNARHRRDMYFRTEIHARHIDQVIPLNLHLDRFAEISIWSSELASDAWKVAPEFVQAAQALLPRVHWADEGVANDARPLWMQTIPKELKNLWRLDMDLWNSGDAAKWCKLVVSAATQLESLRLDSDAMLFGVEKLRLSDHLRVLRVDQIDDFPCHACCFR